MDTTYLNFISYRYLVGWGTKYFICLFICFISFGHVRCHNQLLSSFSNLSFIDEIFYKFHAWCAWILLILMYYDYEYFSVICFMDYTLYLFILLSLAMILGYAWDVGKTHQNMHRCRETEIYITIIHGMMVYLDKGLYVVKIQLQT